MPRVTTGGDPYPLFSPVLTIPGAKRSGTRSSEVFDRQVSEYDSGHRIPHGEASHCRAPAKLDRICPHPNPCIQALWCYTSKLVAMTQDEYAVIDRQ